MPRRRRGRESSSESDSPASEYDGPPQEPWLISQQERGGYKTLKSETRRYDEWCEHGEMVRYPGNGGLFPEGYQPNWQQAKPFRCPIMGCRIACEHLHQVGSHFRAKHRKSLLFDQRNGTFTVFDKKRIPTDKEYRNRRCKWAAVIVKRAPYPGWQAVQQDQQVPVQQAAPAPAVQPAAAAGPPAGPLPAAPAAPAFNVSPRRRGPRPPLEARRRARQASAPAAIQPSPQLPLPGVPPARNIVSSPIRRPRPLPPIPEVRLAQAKTPVQQPAAAAAATPAQFAQRSLDLQSSPIWNYLTALLPHPAPAFPVPHDSAIQTLLTLPRVHALPTSWRNKLKQFSPEHPLTLKDLTSMLWYLAIPKSVTTRTTPCGTENCPVHVLKNSYRELSTRDPATGRRRYSGKSRLEEIMLEFNRPDPEGRKGVRREMGFPRCVAFEEGGLERLEEKAREGVRRAREERGEEAWGGDWMAVRERVGGYKCVNAYWCRGEEVEWPRE